ncbi:MAG: DMT family protein [Campylobacteraceae bacterium]
MIKTVVLLTLSNVFMTFAWYGHLKNLGSKPLIIAILFSWSIAFFEYCLQVPANRIGYNYFTLPQLKIMQEVITMVVFAIFAYFYMGKAITMNYFFAGLCMLGAVYFIFRDSV